MQWSAPGEGEITALSIHNHSKDAEDAIHHVSWALDDTGRQITQSWLVGLIDLSQGLTARRGGAGGLGDSEADRIWTSS